MTSSPITAFMLGALISAFLAGTFLAGTGAVRRFIMGAITGTALVVAALLLADCDACIDWISRAVHQG